MFDDTCYYLSFDSLEKAFFTWILLNTKEIKNFLQSITFLDSKRPYTKEVLMRIDYLKLIENITFDEVHGIAQKVTDDLKYKFDETDFVKFVDSLKIKFNGDFLWMK